ncbi:MAG: zinc ribbon domain-containing protein [Candidatus Binatia bacterium]
MYACPRCQAPFEKGTKFCARCGCNLEEEFLFAPVCPKCGKQFADGTKYCDTDGAILTTAEKQVPRCVTCGKEYPADVKFCPDDGGQILPGGQQAPSGTARGAALASPQLIEHLQSQGYTVKISEYLKKGWEIYTHNIGAFLGATVVILVAYFVLSYVPSFLSFLVLSALSLPVTAGYFIASANVLTRGTTELGDFLKGFDYFLPLALASLLTNLFITVGIILLIIPGVYLTVAYLFVAPLIVDRRFEFWEAMETSRKIVTKNWFPLFGLTLILGIAVVIGALLFTIGLLVAIPFAACTISAAYADIIGLESQQGF